MWNDVIDSVGYLKDKMAMDKGNHEDKEEDADKADQEHEVWMPSLLQAKDWTINCNKSSINNKNFLIFL